MPVFSLELLQQPFPNSSILYGALLSFMHVYIYVAGHQNRINLYFWKLAHSVFLSDYKVPEEGAGFDMDTADLDDHSIAIYVLKARTKGKN